MENRAATSSAKGFLSKIIGFSIATWVGFALSFLSTPITTRLFSPEEMGKINLFTTYMNMFLMFAYLGLDQAYLRFYNEPPGKNTRKGLFTICLICSELFASVLSVGILIAWRPISYSITGANSITIAVFLVISMVSNIAIRYFNLSARMQSRTILYSIQTIALSVVNKILFIVVAFWSPTHIYAIGFITAGYFFMMLLLILTQWKNNCTRSISLRDYTWKTLFSFSLPLVPVSLLSWANNSLAQLLLRNFASFSAIGIYSNAGAVASLIQLLQTGFNVYWIPFVYENYKTNKSKIQKVHQLITLCMVAFGLLIILGQDVLYLLIGEKYRASREFFPFLLVSPVCYTIAETTGVGINIEKKSHLNIITFVVNIGVNLLLCFLLLPVLGVVGAAIASCVSAIAMLVVKTILGEKYYSCVTSYPKTFLAVSIAAVAAAFNWQFYSVTWLRYLSVGVLLLILLAVYRGEVHYLWTFGVETIRDFLRKGKGEI